MPYNETGPRKISYGSVRTESFTLEIWQDDNEWPDPGDCNDMFNTDIESGGRLERRAYEYARSIIPAFRVIDSGLCVEVLYLQGFDLEELDNGHYKANIEYSDERPALQTNFCTLSFTVGGGTVNMKTALQHIADYNCLGRPDAECVNSRGSINVDFDGVQGVERPSNGLNFSITKAFDPLDVTCEYIQQLYYMAPCMNLNPLLGCFAPGEVLFTGASGSGDKSQLYPITFEFSAQPNWYAGPPGLTPSPCLARIVKLGWDYVWFSYKKEQTSRCGHIVVPQAAHVERIFAPINFTLLGIDCE